MDNYEIHQQTYCLSFLSNACGDETGTAASLEQKLQSRVQRFISMVPGSWELGYGPCVYKSVDNPHSGPENAWFAATSTDGPFKYCVVAIAGTAHKSTLAMAGDIDVSAMVDFDDWNSQWSLDFIPSPTPTPVTDATDTRTLISHGIAVAVHNLLTQTGHASPGRFMTLHQYLAQLHFTYTIIFTGHGLGGAIAPTAALGLVEQGLLGRKSVKVVPSAGPSPGVRAFANKYTARFGKSSDMGGAKVFNLVFYNKWDAIPQAWAENASIDIYRNFDNVLGKIYDTAEPDAKEEIGKLVKSMKDSLHKDTPKPPYVPLPGRSFRATKPDKAEKNRIWNDIGMHHTHYYWPAIGIQEFVDTINEECPSFSIAPPLFTETREW